MSVIDLLPDLRVLDLAGEAGVFASRLLADLGADVIRVEPPAGDAVRRRRPFLEDSEGLERSLYHLHFNRNKRSVVMDLDRPAGLEPLLRLAATADVLIETAEPGAMDRLGLGYETLRALNPGLIYTTVTPFGQVGPFRTYRGNDLIGAASSGLLYLNGFPEDPPNVPAAEQAYKMASLVAATGTLLALVGRGRDDLRRGRRVDVSMQEAACMATAQTANANIYHWHRRVSRRMGNTSGINVCGDGKWVSFVQRVGVQDTWEDLVEWLADDGIDTPVLDPEWRDQTKRFERREVVADAIARLCLKHERDYIFHEGQRRRQLVMPVNTVADLVVDHQLKHRSYFAPVQHPELGREIVDSGSPYRFSASQTRASRRAPHLGEHTDEVLRDLPPARPAPTPPPLADPTKPLAGIRVADFSWMIAGPAASRILADFGAEVIKIESQYRVDNIRVVGVQPTLEGSIDTNGVFNDFNTNKLSIQVNVNTPKGLELVKDIIRCSDIVLSNYTAERMPRWGLGYEDLVMIKPDLINLSMPVTGTTGPYRNYGSYGNGVVAYSGLNMGMGFPERPPIGMGPLYSDFAAPYLVVIALLAALHDRDENGRGQFIDFSQLEATISLLGTDVLEYTANGRIPERRGNRSRDFAPHGVYPCAGDDRWCAIAVASDEEWRSLCDAMGRPELANDSRFRTFEARRANEGSLDREVSAWTSTRDAWQVMHQLQGRRLMAAAVADLADMCVRDPWLSNRHFVDLAQEESGVVFKTHQQPMTMDGQRPALRRSPLMGEHTERVLREVLALPNEEIELLTLEQVLY